ncbi:hypothetical protein B7494_g7353 [Chlorociboria aeruginascens]|nr:hypothetical protein B7494_g7353 [Chlorociboria aeruginascens]
MIHICLSTLASANVITFPDTSYFLGDHAKLPTPAEVRQARGSTQSESKPPPVVFEALNLLVKYGQAITIAKGQCLWALKLLLPVVRIPVVYGWSQDSGGTFIYVELIDGITLESCWLDLSDEKRLDIL